MQVAKLTEEIPPQILELHRSVPSRCACMPLCYPCSGIRSGGLRTFRSLAQHTPPPNQSIWHATPKLWLEFTFRTINNFPLFDFRIYFYKITTILNNACSFFETYSTVRDSFKKWKFPVQLSIDQPVISYQMHFRSPSLGQSLCLHFTIYDPVTNNTVGNIQYNSTLQVW